MIQERKTTIRIYHNPRYGKYVGPNRVNKAVFNGTMELEGLGYFVFDAVTFDELGRSNCSDQSRFLGDTATRMSRDPLGCTTATSSQFLSAVLYSYDRTNKTKAMANGIIILSLAGNEVAVVLYDSQDEIIHACILPLHGCPAEKNGKKSPDFLATNYALERAA